MAKKLRKDRTGKRSQENFNRVLKEASKKETTEKNGDAGDKRLYCEGCGKPFDELVAGRCPKCLQKLEKEHHRVRGALGF